MINRMRHAGSAFTLAAFVAFAGGWGQPEPAPKPVSAALRTPPPATPEPQTTVTDLARAYLDLEAAFFAAPVERELCRQVNIAFDDASKLFFAGNLARVIEIVDAQTAKLCAAAGLPAPGIAGGGRDGSQVADVGQAMPPELAGDPAAGSDSRPVAIWSARRDLLTKSAAAGSIESIVAEPRALVGELSAEASRILKRENPYTNRRGDIWRPYFISDQPAPMRLFCPEHREPPAEGWPLVIALHGAGGNEHMFMAGYGAGRIKQLAERHGFIVASPLNSPLAAQPMVFDGLIDSIAADYPIDRSRVYLIGHSMGAGVALAWSKLRADKVAASALIAGVGRFGAKDRLPPTLLIAPELDGLIPARSIIASAEQAKGFGLPVECREIKDYGHTLVVGHVLPEVVEWLLKHPPAADPNTHIPATPGAKP